MKKDTSAYCGESFAVVFYTFQKASEIRPRLISVIKEYFDIVNPVFTKYALNDGKYKNVPSKRKTTINTASLDGDRRFIFIRYNLFR